jgi:hypothetical protein
MNHSKLLIDETPLQVLPSLVNLLGFEKAVILQQIQWLLTGGRSGRELSDGNKWIWKTAKDFAEEYFKFWKPDTIRKHLAGLERTGILLSCQANRKEWDRTKYYRINYEKLEALLNRPAKTAPKRHPRAASTGQARAASL